MRNPLTEEIAVMRLFICKIKMIHCTNATMRDWISGGGRYICQLSVKLLAICQLSVKFKAFCQLNFFYFISFALKNTKKTTKQKKKPCRYANTSNNENVAIH